MAGTGIVLGSIGVVGAVSGEIGSGGTASPLAIAVAGFSANTVASSTHDFVAIARGDLDAVGSFNIGKSGVVLISGNIADGIEGLASILGIDIEITENGELLGGYAFEGADFIFGAYGVNKGVQTISRRGYRFVDLNMIEGNMIGNTYVQKSTKVGAGVEISHTIAVWFKKTYEKLFTE